MGRAEKPIEEVRKAIQAIYQNPARRELYASLDLKISLWEKKSLLDSENEDQRILDGLQSLLSFLVDNDYEEYAKEIFSLIIKSLPEIYFPESPRIAFSKETERELAEKSSALYGSAEISENAKASFRLFHKQLQMIENNIRTFIGEAELENFHERGIGSAGDLYRTFFEAAQRLENTPMQDLSWMHVNHLSMRINNSFCAFIAAYNIAKTLNGIENTKPSGWLRDEIVRNENFFLRNKCWKYIDEALMKRDNVMLLKYVDKALPAVTGGFERDYLLSLRAKAVSSDHRLSMVVLASVLGAVIVIALISMISYEPEMKRSIDLDKTRKHLMEAIRSGIAPGPLKKPEDRQIGAFIPDLDVRSRTGLRERKPPIKPHDRNLNLFEIRHAVFQQYRLQYLDEQSLSPDEKKKLKALWEDWRQRCEFYTYDNEIREKIHWDLKIHGPTLIQDAQDILNSWRPEKDPVLQKNLKQAGGVLSLKNPLHMRLVVERLRKLGYYRSSGVPGAWNDDCRRALIDFKISNMSIIDDVWDQPTQKALMGN